MYAWCVPHILGEFGVVYKGYLTGQHTNEIVAIKTLKGISDELLQGHYRLLKEKRSCN